MSNAKIVETLEQKIKEIQKQYDNGILTELEYVYQIRSASGIAILDLYKNS
jgi:hypothetical protein